MSYSSLPDDSYTFDDLMNEPQKPADWLIEGLFMTRSINHLIGRVSSGKSVIALQICKSIREGEDFLGFKPTKQGTILFFGLEDARTRIKDRVRRQKWKVDPTLSKVVFNNELLLTTPAGYAKLETLVKKYEPILVVIDPLLMVIGGKGIDLNSNTHMAEFARKMRELIAKHGVAFLVVHHSRKIPYKTEDTGEIDSGMGATANLGLSDTRLILFGKEDEKRVRTFGKDVEPDTFSIKQDVANYSWVKKRPYNKRGE